MDSEKSLRGRFDCFFRRIAILALLAVATPSAYAQVYKCTEHGATVYSDKPCPESNGKTLSSSQLSGNSVGSLNTQGDLDRHRDKTATEQQDQQSRETGARALSNPAAPATLSDNDYRMEYARIDQLAIQASHHPQTQGQVECFKQAKDELERTHQKSPFKCGVDPHLKSAIHVVGSCDVGGCTDVDGNHYSRSGPNYIDAESHLCTPGGGVLTCSRN